MELVCREFLARFKYSQLFPHRALRFYPLHTTYKYTYDNKHPQFVETSISEIQTFGEFAGWGCSHRRTYFHRRRLRTNFASTNSVFAKVGVFQSLNILRRHSINFLKVKNILHMLFANLSLNDKAASLVTKNATRKDQLSCFYKTFLR